MTAATKDRTEKFFAGATGDQGSEGPALLPIKASEGAPANNEWLCHMVEGEQEIRYASADSHPYINYRSEIDEPEDYAERVVFGMFWFPRTVDEDAVAIAVDEVAGNVNKAIAAAHESYDRQQARVVGQIDAILGTGTVASLGGETLEECLEELIPLLDNAPFVGKIVRERGKKLDPSDEDKDAERYPDRNRISFFKHAGEWEG